MSYHTPEAKTEQAFKAMFDALSDTDLNGVQLIQRGSVDDIATPSLSIIASKCDPADSGEGPSGNWFVSVDFTLNTHYKENSIVAHDEWLGVITDLVCDQTVVTTLNALMKEEEFTAMQWTLGSREHSIQDHLFVSKVSGVLYMLPSKEGD